MLSKKISTLKKTVFSLVFSTTASTLYHLYFEKKEQKVDQPLRLSPLEAQEKDTETDRDYIQSFLAKLDVPSDLIQKFKGTFRGLTFEDLENAKYFFENASSETLTSNQKLMMIQRIDSLRCLKIDGQKAKIISDWGVFAEEMKQKTGELNVQTQLIESLSHSSNHSDPILRIRRCLFLNQPIEHLHEMVNKLIGDIKGKIESKNIETHSVVLLFKGCKKLKEDYETFNKFNRVWCQENFDAQLKESKKRVEDAYVQSFENFEKKYFLIHLIENYKGQENLEELKQLFNPFLC